jgi:hypothetical protein
MVEKDFHDLTPEQLAHTLERTGEYPHPDLIRAVVARREEMETLLLEMFATSFHDDWPAEEDARWFRLEHSGKILIGWQSAAAAPIFGDLYLSEPLQDALEIFEVDPWTIGPPAVPEFIRVISTPTGEDYPYGRALAGSILRNIALVYPETRDAVVEALRAQLPPLESIPTLTDDEYDVIWSIFITELADLQGKAAEAQVLALFDADMVDESYLDREDYLTHMRGEGTLLWPEPFDPVAHYERLYTHQLDLLRQLEKDNERRARELRATIELQTKIRANPKIGRNDPCPCGSGKKYKHCHGKPG